LIENAWLKGDPGVVFLDEINRTHPLPDIVEGVNPCGEAPLLPYESCILGSINLGTTTDDELEDLVRLGVRFLDNVLSITKFAAEEVREATLKTRKIGLGVMGWHDYLLKKGIPYASKLAVDEALRLGEYINEIARDESERLAVERGAYPACTGTPIRNACRTSIAPTGSLSLIAGCSPGIEPVFAWVNKRNVLGGIVEVHPVTETRRFNKFVNGKGTEQDALLFATAREIPWQWHIIMLAAWQRNIDQGVSKTCNMPHDATVEDVDAAFRLAYKLGCKGLAIYRDGSKEGQIMEEMSCSRGTCEL
jgi:ribonucleoside-diphosphate reductase alpha chain